MPDPAKNYKRNHEGVLRYLEKHSLAFIVGGIMFVGGSFLYSPKLPKDIARIDYISKELTYRKSYSFQELVESRHVIDNARRLISERDSLRSIKANIDEQKNVREHI